MEGMDNTEDSNIEIHIDVEENNEHVELSESDSIEVEISDGKSLESFLEEEIATLPRKLFDIGIIYKVSEKYRKVKEESYTPRIVSIGPLHHGKSHLQAMETYKLRCLKSLKIKCGIKLKELSQYASSCEYNIRSYYQDFNFTSLDFSKMILLDGIFIILLIGKDKERFSGIADPFLSGNKSWRTSDIMHDMLLLENQLPLFFVKGLLKILDELQKVPSDSDFFSKDLHKYFLEVGITNRLETIDFRSALHLVDYLLRLHLPPDAELPDETEEQPKAEHGRSLNVISDYTRTRSTSELQEAGVRFIPLPSGGLFEVLFNKLTGELRIPQLTVNGTTETFFRNVIALEQCLYSTKHITSYVIFMDSLINTSKDVDLLVKHKIIDNLLGEEQLVADLFNNLHKEAVEDQREFYFADTCKDLNEYSKDWFHQWRSSWFKWKLMLRNNYFSNPWSVISFIAATIVVVLTIVQTVCAISGL
ncbi:UPF0481 protein At3g47200-like [Apium graveolens]|uniref:Uncharacterized protein n=1 Tax=Apium graveolens TaxID=4045 RepID=A0A6L5BB59_APIGR|nr:hypothetical protein AG4045_005143 [Apium graveolens]